MMNQKNVVMVAVKGHRKASMPERLAVKKAQALGLDIKNSKKVYGGRLVLKSRKAGVYFFADMETAKEFYKRNS